MKNKLAALLAALLLMLSVLPTQALAAEDPDPVDPPAATDTEDPGSLARKSGSGSGGSQEDPGRTGGEH